ncbi:helix-hairpin-helix domain-containing protein [Daejeonella oryzae]|uniref:helix-hairpin-helix domain-containing protein n=1 Tax=Daejeonella oryzae TaxID=1122943 RepID=UPI001FE0787D|nr:helix-hairpin-helix domain-containing protein [Daejeonella oryzae]
MDKLFAQVENNQIIELLIEDLAESLAEDFDFSEITERLNYYHKYPVEINKITDDQLKELFFLSPVQINNFINHRAENGKIIDLLELQSIDDFDLLTIKRLLNFVYLSAPNSINGLEAKLLIAEGNHDLMLRFSQLMERQKGYLIPESSTGSRYLGSPQKLLLRYRYNYGRNISASFNAEKDAGEQLFSNSGKGFDFYSGSLSFQNIGRINKLVLGDFSLQFGQGLTMWSGLSFGKGALVTSVAKPDFGLKAYTSVNEILFFRGAAAKISIRRFSITPFVSYKNLDASLTETDSLNSTSQVSSLGLSGLHRTKNENENKNALTQFIAGANLQYQHKNIRAGIVSYHNRYNYQFEPGRLLYNKFEFSQRSLSNFGTYYAYNIKNAYIFGEASHSAGSGYAYVNGIITSISPQVSVVLLHRNYQKDYHSFYNQAFSEASNAVNEKGFYSGLLIKPNSKLELAAYADLFKFPWMKFGVDAPSSGYEIFSQVTYSPNKKFKIYARIKRELKDENDHLINEVNGLEQVCKQSGRLEINYKIIQGISLRNRFEVSNYQKSEINDLGYLAYQDIIYDPMQSKLSGNIRLAFFKTEGFNSRIYAYENDVLYSYSIMAYQNSGVRFYFNSRYQLRRGVDLWFKYSLTNYKDLDKIGSGLDEINGSNRSEVKFQFRYQF